MLAGFGYVIGRHASCRTGMAHGATALAATIAHLLAPSQPHAHHGDRHSALWLLAVHNQGTPVDNPLRTCAFWPPCLWPVCSTFVHPTGLGGVFTVAGAGITAFANSGERHTAAQSSSSSRALLQGAE